jgi:hypothetical protein
MSFILDAQRRADVSGAFARYRAYLDQVRHQMPASAYGLASSDWYFNFNDHRCPHDAWLESIIISEPSSGRRDEERATSIRIRLLGARHDGFIEFYYPCVSRYRIDAIDAAGGHKDWRYDEFRLSDEGGVIHEIEWCGTVDTARWVIEATDVHYQWLPFGG